MIQLPSPLTKTFLEFYWSSEFRISTGLMGKEGRRKGDLKRRQSDIPRIYPSNRCGVLKLYQIKSP